MGEKVKPIDIIVKTQKGGIKIPDMYRLSYDNMLAFCDKTRGGYIRLKISPPFKKRSTGEKSQNHHINGHIQQIANETGEEFEVIKDYAKKKAVKYGYPIRTDILGNARPLSETEIDTEAAGYLIEAVHELAAFLEITLYEQ